MKAEQTNSAMLGRERRMTIGETFMAAVIGNIIGHIIVKATGYTLGYNQGYYDGIKDFVVHFLKRNEEGEEDDKTEVQTG